MSNAHVEMTLSAAGLSALIKDMVALVPARMKEVKDYNEEGRHIGWKEVAIPDEEVFTLVAIRTGENGSFVVRVNTSDLKNLTATKALADKAAEYSAIA